MQNINFLSSVVLVYWCPFVTIFRCSNLQSHCTFSKGMKLHQILSQFSSKNTEQALDINTVGRDYSNLNHPIPSKDFNLQYIYKVYCREQGQRLMQQKSRTLWHYIFKKDILPRIFLNLVPEESFIPKCTFLIKFRSKMKL